MYMIGRQKEMALLEELYNSTNFEFLNLYGRRRVGKSTLLTTFSEKQKTLYEKYISAKQKYFDIIDKQKP